MKDQNTQTVWKDLRRSCIKSANSTCTTENTQYTPLTTLLNFHANYFDYSDIVSDQKILHTFLSLSFHLHSFYFTCHFFSSLEIKWVWAQGGVMSFNKQLNSSTRHRERVHYKNVQLRLSFVSEGIRTQAASQKSFLKMLYTCCVCLSVFSLSYLRLEFFMMLLLNVNVKFCSGIFVNQCVIYGKCFTS